MLFSEIYNYYLNTVKRQSTQGIVWCAAIFLSYCLRFWVDDIQYYFLPSISCSLLVFNNPLSSGYWNLNRCISSTNGPFVPNLIIINLAFDSDLTFVPRESWTYLHPLGVLEVSMESPGDLGKHWCQGSQPRRCWCHWPGAWCGPGLWSPALHLTVSQCIKVKWGSGYQTALEANIGVILPI